MCRGSLVPAPGGPHSTALLLSVGLFLAACGGDGTGPSVDPAAPGTPLTDPGVVAVGSTLAWSVDGTEIYFSAGASAGVPAMALLGVRVSDGAVRTLNSDATDRIFTDHQGTWVYRWSWRDEVGVVERVPAAGGVPELVARGTEAHNGFHSLNPVLSPDDAILAYALVGEDTTFGGALDPMGTLDTLVLHDLASDERTPMGFGMPLAFSPDGGELAFAPRPCLDRALGQNPCETHVLELADGSTRAYERQPSVYGVRVLWTEAGLQELAYAWDADAWVLRNLTEGTDRPLVDFVGPYQRLEVAADGTRFAGWDYQNDELGEAVVVVYDLDHGPLVAAAHEEGDATALALAPDGDRIAYVVDGALYVKDLPATW